MGEWNREWWKQVNSIPWENNPARDTDLGYHCNVGQGGNVWFLHGVIALDTSASSNKFNRVCNIPHDDIYVFIPVLNELCDTVASWSRNIADPLTYHPRPWTEQLFAERCARPFTPGAFPQMKLEVGPIGSSPLGVVSAQQIEDNFRSKFSEFFSYILPVDNVYSKAHDQPVTPGIYEGVVDGYCAMLRLTKGDWTVRVTNPFSTVTYTVSVGSH